MTITDEKIVMVCEHCGEPFEKREFETTPKGRSSRKLIQTCPNGHEATAHFDPFGNLLTRYGVDWKPESEVDTAKIDD